MQAPLEPLPHQCCGNGCENCVWHRYDRELLRYRVWLEQQPKQQELIWSEPDAQVARDQKA
jgi:hypothetical protein